MGTDGACGLLFCAAKRSTDRWVLKESWSLLPDKVQGSFLVPNASSAH
jgi:hypothetical protein